MFEKVPASPELVPGEHAVLRWWDEARVFDRLRAQNAAKPRWSFLDGPITANNPMGVHHAWGRTLKDVFQRYFAMTGHELRYQNGFDCQGLWVEVEVEKDHKFRSKRDIEAYGLEKFINDCKDRVLRFSRVQTDQSIRLGYWMDWSDSYYTMSDENNYAIWDFLKRCHGRGLIYKGLDAMPWCPRCGTGISEQERSEGYRPVEDESVYLRFPLRGRPGEALLVWTTTPWTLPANVAAAVHPELTYARVRQGDAVYYVAKGRLGVLDSERQSRGAAELLAELRGAELVGWEYDGPFDELEATAPARPAHRVIAWSEVTETDGTGIVHIAPGCGKEDFELGCAEGLPVLAPIDDEGHYVGGAAVRENRVRRGKPVQFYTGGYGMLAGESAPRVAPAIYESLRAKRLFYTAERYAHSYPHCWRCSTALVFRAVDEWYIDMSWREEIKEVVRQIRWIPEYGRDLELDWLKNMGDWMISKKRYWGLALPIFECRACGTFDVIGGRDELHARAVSGWDAFEGHSPHRPWVDRVAIACPQCGAPATRIPDVGNPWLDAGIVAYSTTRYFCDRDYWARWIPADVVLEALPGQFRNWFYAMLAMSTMMEQIPPFRTLLGHAMVRDERGEEMHKSKGNAIWFDDAVEKMGADVMRWIYCRQNPLQNLNFGYTPGKQVERQVFNTLWNSYAFFTNYARLDAFDPRMPGVPVPERPEIDRWILSNLQRLIASARRNFEDYSITPVVRQAEEFIDELSNWYIRRNRPRFWRSRGQDDRDKLAAYQTLYEVLVTLTRVLAPIIPFLAERIYRNLTQGAATPRTGGEAAERGGRASGASAAPLAAGGSPASAALGAGLLAPPPDSVHLAPYPAVDATLIDETLSFQMGVVRQVVGVGHALREKAGERTRQPLAEVRVAVPDAEHRAALERLGGLVADELNVKRLDVVESLGDLTSVSAKPNFGVLGPRYGKDVPKIARALGRAPIALLRRLQTGETVTLDADGRTFELSPADVAISVKTETGWVVDQTGALPVALDTRLTPELRREGLARDVVRHIQQLRKETGLEIEDHIAVSYETDNTEFAAAIEQWSEYICAETLCEQLTTRPLGGTPKELKIGNAMLRVEIRKV